MTGDEEKLTGRNQRSFDNWKKILYNNSYLPLGSDGILCLRSVCIFSTLLIKRAICAWAEWLSG